MSDIELVIKMPESIWVAIQNGEYCGILDVRTYNAIKNGTPLSADGDCISRQAVLNTLDNMDKALDEERTVEKYKELLTECIKVLPSAENKGEWIDNQTRKDLCNCSKCFALSKVYSKFCPNCGADMRGE